MAAERAAPLYTSHEARHRRLVSLRGSVSTLRLSPDLACSTSTFLRQQRLAVPLATLPSCGRRQLVNMYSTVSLVSNLAAGTYMSAVHQCSWPVVARQQLGQRSFAHQRAADSCGDVTVKSSLSSPLTHSLGSNRER